MSFYGLFFQFQIILLNIKLYIKTLKKFFFFSLMGDTPAKRTVTSIS